MARQILIIQGHPDPEPAHFGHALAKAYSEGAELAGHELRTISIANLDFPLLRSKQEWDHGQPVADIRRAQQDIAWAQHILLIYPLWLGALPALVKAFLEQVLRPGFALGEAGSRHPWEKRLRGKSARIVVTMGMPALVYRWIFMAHSLKNLQRNILSFCGIAPIRTTLIGRVDNPKIHYKWLARLHRLGQAGT